MRQAALATAVTILVGLAGIGSHQKGSLGAATPTPINPPLPFAHVTLPAGWNIVSAEVASLLATQSGSVTAYTYAAGGSAYRTVVFENSHPPAFTGVGSGYWV